MCLFREQVRRFRKTFGLRVLCEDIALPLPEMNGAFLEPNRDDSTNGLGDSSRAFDPLTKYAVKDRVYDEISVSVRCGPRKYHSFQTEDVTLCFGYIYSIPGPGY